MNMKGQTTVIGNDYKSDSARGFKDDVKHIFETYSSGSMDFSRDFGSIIGSPSNRGAFVDSMLESLTTSPVTQNAACANAPFYNNYNDRVQQLLENSMHKIAQESAIIGYTPIVAYNPFFLKKQWVSCVFKDILMTEVPTSPIIELAFEKRFLKTQDGKEYEMPDCFYDKALMAKLRTASTGIPSKENYIDISTCKNLHIVNSTYFDGAINGDITQELTADLAICKVKITGTNGTYEKAVDIKIDTASHNFLNGDVTYVETLSDGTQNVITDTLLGQVNFDKGTITLMSTDGKITHIALRGKLANRFNNRSLDVVRKVQRIHHTMPESGERLNTAVTIEDAADALALQNVDVIADNIDMMGKTLAELEDFGIRDFLSTSFERENQASFGPHGYDKMTVESSFDSLPYEGFTARVTDWMKDSKEYFERTIAALKMKLKTTDAIIVCVSHPNLVRFLQEGINWVFTDDTQISGMKISYNFGVYTSAQDRVHIITSMYMEEDEGLRFIVIPLTKELATFKHYKYNAVIDRNYRNPIYTLTPNIMVTHRTLTFEVLPVQGIMKITGRDLHSPETLKRAGSGTKTLSSIAITQPPTKVTYTSGQSFESTGMVVTATYSDGTTAAVTGYSVTPSGALATSDTTVTVSYTEGTVTKTATQAITVTA